MNINHSLIPQLLARDLLVYSTVTFFSFTKSKDEP